MRKPDTSVFKYGSECINAVLAGDNSLKTLWRKNAKRLATYKHWLAIFNMPADQMPVGKIAINARQGDPTRFIGDEKGSWIGIGGCAFHPAAEFRPNDFTGKETFNMRHMGRSFWEPYTAENWDLWVQHRIGEMKLKIQTEIGRIEPFLARILAKGLAGQQAATAQPK